MLNRWTDDRLDELLRQVERTSALLGPALTQLAVMENEMGNLTREMTRNTEATAELNRHFEKIQREPIERWRGFRSALTIGVLSAGVGGSLAVLGAVLAKVLG